MTRLHTTGPQVLIVGGSGFLGAELIQQANAAGNRVAATYATAPGDVSQAAWHQLDLRDVGRLDAIVAEAAPHIIVNASSGGADWPVTAAGPIRLAMLAARHGVRMVQVSSDAVFSGTAVDYDESALPDPITPYGAAKAAAETGILAVYPAAVVARTSLIIGYGRSEHERLVHALVSGSVDGVLFRDDVRCPVHVTDLAAALLELAVSGAAGIRHTAGADAVSRHALGVLIAERDGLDPERLPAGRRAGSGLPGAIDVRLRSQATQRRLKTRLRGAREFLRPGS
ncbi:SDR family oxidoreductase [Streptomyces sp. NPDC048638]|uniref:SDR family oxidoreductase n=1 Tax=Streptomyces sp. NPDC048638 TaxID=3365580 RepID=UPI003712900D